MVVLRQKTTKKINELISGNLGAKPPNKSCRNQVSFYASNSGWYRLLLNTLIPEVFLDFSLLEIREPRSGENDSRSGKKVFPSRRFTIRGRCFAAFSSQADKNQEKPLRSR